MRDDEISFREHFEELLRNAEELQDERWAAHQRVHDMGQKAIDAALFALEARLAQMNEFRAQVLEERRAFVKYEVYRAEHESLDGKFQSDSQALGHRINMLEQYKANLDGRFWMLGGGITLLGGALTIGLNLLFRYWAK